MKNEWDQFPVASPVDVALQAEGVTEKVADVARSIYQQESGSGKNTKTSNAGAVGGMQILPATFKSVADDGWDINDPVHNARAGIRYVKQMNDLAGGDPALTATGYYSGPGGLAKARKGIAVSDPRNPNAPNSLGYGKQVAARVSKGPIVQALDKVTDAILPSANAQEVPTAKGQTAPATFTFEEAQLPAGQSDLPTGMTPSSAGAGRGSVNPPLASDPPKRSMIDELGRQLGLTVRAGISGAASIPAMAADAVTGPINAGLDAVAGKGNGFRFQPAGAALSNVMTGAGLPEPENATERVVQDAASSVAGTGGILKAGKVLEGAAGPVAQGVGKLLSSGPQLQLASAATGAGAAGVTRENGGGAGAQVAAGLVGSVAPIGLAYSGRQPNGSKQLLEAATKAHGEGYVIPPSDLNPGMLTSVASGLSGKTAQAASQRNQNITNQLARKALGIAADADLTTESLAFIRKDAGQAYQAVAGAGVITPSASYATALDDAVKPFLSQARSFPNRKLPTLVDDIQALKTGQFDAADAVETIKVIRNEADAAYRAGDNLGGKAYKQAARALEDAIDEHLVKINAPADLLNGYRAARQTIAKTYTVEKALNSQTGNVNAQKLAGDLAKGKPLSAELKTIAEVAQAFPKATQALKEAPKHVSLIDVLTGAGAALTGSNPALLGAIAVRPAVRSALLSKPIQRMAIKGAGLSNTGIPDGIEATAVGAATRFKESAQPAPGTTPQWTDFPEVGAQEPTQQGVVESTQPVDPSVPPNVNNSEQLTKQPVAASQAPSVSDSGDGGVTPTWSPTQETSEPNPEQPTHDFTSKPLSDGTLSIKGDAQALRDTLLAAGIPAKGILTTRNGILIGRAQASRVQAAIDRMAQPGSESVAAPAPIDVAAHEAATSHQNDLPQPTPAQQTAGNYTLGHDRIAGMDVSIENPQGSVRRGVGADGVPWETQMRHHYGYFKKTSATDGHKLDVFIKPGTPRDFSGPVFVVDQVDPQTGKLDEHKAILGASDEDEAKAIYHANYHDGWQGAGAITRLPLPAFKAWAASGDKRQSLGDISHKLAASDAADQPVTSGGVATATEAVGAAPAVAQTQVAPAPAASEGTAAPAPLQSVASATPGQHPELARIQQLRDAGEHRVAALLQRNHERNQTLNDVQSELASMQTATPDLPHHGHPAFNDHYQQQRLAGLKPAEASGYAGLLHALQLSAPAIGMPDRAVKMLAEKVKDVPIDKFPGVAERFVKGLIERGVMQPFEGSGQIASALEHARDSAILGAVDSLYGGQHGA